MDQRQALLNGIIHDPEDDGARLVIADWFEENGEPARAEFIRAQIERAGLAFDDDRRAALQARERRLLLTHAKEWLGDDFELGPGGAWRFRRGFVESLRLTAAQFLQGGRTTFDRHPVTDLTLFSLGSNAVIGRLLGGHARMDRLRSLCLPFERDTSADPVLALLGSRHLAGLRRLELFEMPLAGRLEEVLALPAAGQLEALGLGWTGCADADLQVLLQSPLVERLERLDLDFTAVTFAGLRALADSPLWRRLSILDTFGLPLTGDCVEGLAEIIASSRLRRLGLSMDDDTARQRGLGAGDLLVGFDALLAAPAWGDVRHLALYGYQPDEDRWHRFAQHPSLGSVEHLELIDIRSGASAVAALAASPHLRSLRNLTLTSDYPETLDDGCLNSLLDAPWLSGLVELQLGRCRCSATTIERFLCSPRLGRLRRLRLDEATPDAPLNQAALDARTAHTVANESHLTNLTSLVIPMDPSTADEVIETLVGAERLPLLTLIEPPLHRPGERTVRAVLDAPRPIYVDFPPYGIEDDSPRAAYGKHFGRVSWRYALP